MSNVDQGLRPLADGPTRQISHTIFCNHHIERFTVGKLIGVIGNGKDNIGVPLPVPAGKGKEGPPIF